MTVPIPVYILPVRMMIFLFTISLAYADAHPNMESGGFSNGITNGAQWYSISGGMQDWNYIWEGDCDITLEQNEVKWPSSNQADRLVGRP